MQNKSNPPFSKAINQLQTTMKRATQFVIENCTFQSSL